MMRRDAAAREARRQRAQERLQASQADASPSKLPRVPVPSTTAEALAFAESLDWSATRTKDGYRLTHPSGATTMMHLTISDRRAWNNLRADLVRPARLVETDG